MKVWSHLMSNKVSRRSTTPSTCTNPTTQTMTSPVLSPPPLDRRAPTQLSANIPSLSSTRTRDMHGAIASPCALDAREVATSLLRSAHPNRDSSRRRRMGSASLAPRLSMTTFFPRDIQSAGAVMDRAIEPISSSISMSAGTTVDPISSAAAIAAANSSVRGRASLSSAAVRERFRRLPQRIAMENIRPPTPPVVQPFWANAGSDRRAV
mmetsp:Transcript_3816/g.9739  ORF Transcript_3816/g.9739 Transcript_3816/m.9739 type:complete len:209 (+) Transcript_3816:190-816(+)